jgi:hypothetical protein
MLAKLPTFSLHQSHIVVLVTLEMLEHKHSLIINFVVEGVTMDMGAID